MAEKRRVDFVIDNYPGKFKFSRDLTEEELANLTNELQEDSELLPNMLIRDYFSEAMNTAHDEDLNKWAENNSNMYGTFTVRGPHWYEGVEGDEDDVYDWASEGDSAEGEQYSYPNDAGVLKRYHKDVPFWKEERHFGTDALDNLISFSYGDDWRKKHNINNREQLEKLLFDKFSDWKTDLHWLGTDKEIDTLFNKDYARPQNSLLRKAENIKENLLADRQRNIASALKDTL